MTYENKLTTGRHNHQRSVKRWADFFSKDGDNSRKSLKSGEEFSLEAYRDERKLKISSPFLPTVNTQAPVQIAKRNYPKTRCLVIGHETEETKNTQFPYIYYQDPYVTGPRKEKQKNTKKKIKKK